MTTPSTPPVPEDDAREPAPPQDTFRRIYFGTLQEPLVPPHPGPQESPDEELIRAALEDPEADRLHLPRTEPTAWRLVVVISFAIAALGSVFWWFR